MYLLNIYRPVVVVAFFLTAGLGDITNSAQAAELVIEPAAPLVEVGGKRTLSVFGTRGDIIWNPTQGKIEGVGNRVNYIAPTKVGVDAISVLDNAGNMGKVTITVLPKGELSQSFAPDNANWKVFTNRNTVNALALSQNGDILWVGTNGGLEQRETSTGRLIRLYTHLDGLPHNRIKTLLADGFGGVWVGTYVAGIGHLHANGSWEIFNSENSELRNDRISSLQSDGKGGIWIGTSAELVVENFISSDGLILKNEANGLAHLHADGHWDIFDADNFPLSDNWVFALVSDNEGGVWVGTFLGNLAHLRADGTWEIFDSKEFPWANRQIFAIQLDGKGGIWVGMTDIFGALDGSFKMNGGLVHFLADGSWKLFDSTNSPITNNNVISLVADSQGGIWIGTITNGLIHLDTAGQWENFNISTPGQSYNNVISLMFDKSGRLWAGTTDKGLMRFHLNDNHWENLYNPKTPRLLDNHITGIQSDGKGGIWVGTNGLYGVWGGGLARLNPDGSWESFNKENSPLPNNSVRTILSDGLGGVWVGTDDVLDSGGLAHLKVNADGTYSWDIFTTENSELPDNTVFALALDGTGGIWIGTVSGLARLHADMTWEIFSLPHLPFFEMPVLEIRSLVSEPNGGVWMGTKENGLIHRQADGRWEVFNTGNSDLPNNQVNVLFLDSNGELWVGTGEKRTEAGGLVHLDAKGHWEVFNINNSGLRSNVVSAILSDGAGGLWVGTRGSSGVILQSDAGGLAHFRADRTWDVFDTTNSSLPQNDIPSLLSDGEGGFWVGSFGLAHLNFGERQRIVQTIQAEKAEELLTNRRAAILIHPNGKGRGFGQEYAVDFMASYVYQSLFARGYDYDEIYFISYRPDLDYNRDGYPDFNVVDAPVTLADIRNDGKAPLDVTMADIHTAFEWAKTQRKLDEPLVIIFVDHGLPDKLLLDPQAEEVLNSEAFKILLDDYYQTTGNSVVVILEACHTGTLGPTLVEGSSRLIITSTNEDLSYYDDMGRTSFIKLYFDRLRRGFNYWNAWQNVTETILTYPPPFNQQRPQLQPASEGEMARHLCLNGCFEDFIEVSFTSQMPTSLVKPEQSIALTVQTNTNKGSINQVWASVITPEIALKRTAQGYSLLPTPMINFHEDDKHQWQGHFSGFKTRGEYIFTFKAEDNTGFITEAQPITLFVDEGNRLTLSQFDAVTNRLFVPAVTIPNAKGGTDVYQAELSLQSFEPPFIFELDSLSPVQNSNAFSYANFSNSTGLAHIPFVEIPNGSGGMDTASANLQLVEPQSSPLQFEVVSIKKD
jgi:ligand-binding sensor domain-containing protein